MLCLLKQHDLACWTDRGFFRLIASHYQWPAQSARGFWGWQWLAHFAPTAERRRRFAKRQIVRQPPSGARSKSKPRLAIPGFSFSLIKLALSICSDRDWRLRLLNWFGSRSRSHLPRSSIPNSASLPAAFNRISSSIFNRPYWIGGSTPILPKLVGTFFKFSSSGL